MLTNRPSRRTERGQMVVLFAITLTVVVLGVGLVIDGGNALVQRRGSQNASDFAALAGARIIAEWIGGDTTNGTDANVKAAIANAVTTNGGAAVTFGSPSGPVYVNQGGAIVPSAGVAASFVGNGTIPTGAAGVQVSANRTWRPFFLGIIGVNNWNAAASATAKGGFSAGGPGTDGSGLFPAGIAKSFFDAFPFCSGDISTDPASPCYPKNLTPGNLNVPGGFGWLKFGCTGYGLGQDPPANIGGCGNSKPFLQGEIDPSGNTYGCCTEVGIAGLDRIGSLPGNKASADCSYYIDNQITVTVPVWDTAGGNGSNGWYHIIGFAGFQITDCFGGKNISGVWRKAFFDGPTTSTNPTPGFPGAALGVQLVH
jgi:Flp pilus assembly protein TadG